MGSENASFETPISFGCSRRPKLREWWVGEKLAFVLTKAMGLSLVGGNPKTMRRSLCFLRRYFKEGSMNLIFGHGVPEQKTEL